MRRKVSRPFEGELRVRSQTKREGMSSSTFHFGSEGHLQRCPPSFLNFSFFMLLGPRILSKTLRTPTSILSQLAKSMSSSSAAAHTPSALGAPPPSPLPSSSSTPTTTASVSALTGPSSTDKGPLRMQIIIRKDLDVSVSSSLRAKRQEKETSS